MRKTIINQLVLFVFLFFSSFCINAKESEKNKNASTIFQQVDFINLFVNEKKDVLINNDTPFVLSVISSDSQANDLEVSFRFLQAGFGVVKTKEGAAVGTAFNAITRGTQEFIINTNRKGSSGLLIQLRSKVTGEVKRRVTSVRSRQVDFRLKGKSEVFLRVGDTFTDPGFVAIDANEGDVSSKVEVDASNLNINAVGRYAITYKLTRQAGDSSFLNRIIDVSANNISVESISPEIQNLILDVNNSFPGIFMISPRNASFSDLEAVVVQGGLDVRLIDTGIGNDPGIEVFGFEEGFGEIEIRSKTTDAKALFFVEVLPEPAPPTSIAIIPRSLEIETGDERRLSLFVEPINVEPVNYLWNSTDTSVATVSSTGNITALKAGKTTIEVSIVEYPNIKNSIEVTVIQKILPTSLDLDFEEITLEVFRSQQVTATVGPVNAMDKRISWSSNDPGIVTVSQNGLIKAEQVVGNTTVTATLVANPSVSKTVNVSVEVFLKGMRFDFREKMLNIGQTLPASTVIFNPSNATNKSITWSSFKPSVATVDSNGVVTAVGEGQTFIIATSVSKPEVKAAYELNVIDPVVNVTSVKIGRLTNQQKLLPYGSTLQLSAAISPNNATDKGIIWRSKDTRTATVNTSGLVTPVRQSLVTIEALSKENNAIKDAVDIRVYAFPSILENDGDIFSRPGETVKVSLDIDSVLFDELGNEDQGRGTIYVEVSKDRFRNISESKAFPYVGELRDSYSFTLPSNGFSSVRVRLVPERGKSDDDELRINIQTDSKTFTKRLSSLEAEPVSFP